MFGAKTSPVEGVPVIPGGSWYAGHLHMMQETDFQKSIRSFSVDFADKNGRCTFWMGPTTPSLSVTHCEDVMALLKVSSHRELFPIMGVHMEKLFGRFNVAVLTGSEWKQKRGLVVKALHGRETVDNNKRAFEKAASVMAGSLRDKSKIDDLLLYMKMLTFDAFGLATLSTDFGCCKELKPAKLMDDFEFLSTEVMRRMGRDILNPTSHVYSLPTAANRRCYEVSSRVDATLGEIVMQRRKDLEEHSPALSSCSSDLLLSLIQNLQGKEDEVSGRMLLDILKSLMFAGFETSSVTLTYCLYLIARHSGVEDRCLREINSNADERVYLESVVKETLRLYPPAISTTRSLERDITIGENIHVPKGTYLYFPIWVIQRLERHFPDPLRFSPERWAKLQEGKWIRREMKENEVNDVAAGNSDAFVAFSAGARNCAGQRFAMQEMVSVLSVLLQQYKFDVPPEYELQPHRDGFVQCPKDPIPVTISRRSAD